MTRRFGIVHGFTLIEVVIAVVVLAIAVPPTLNLMDSASAGRVNAINVTRAACLSTLVLETVIADMASADPALGFSALDDPSVYLESPTNGLYARLAALTAPYSRVGITYTLEIGPLVASDGMVSDNTGENVFRMIAVNIKFVSANSSPFVMPVSIMVSEL